jgi:16S rRNA (adenine1518-N6/adenine1519-N6)-dimethyltransferase
MIVEAIMGRKKLLGQHFLIDQNIARKIVQVAEIRPEETVLEIGSGRGVLTRLLIPRVKRLIAIELDRNLYHGLEKEFDGASGLSLVHADALEYPYESIEGPFKVVSNLPYSITTPLLFRLLELGAKISGMTLMIQKEVADRIIAKPGSKTYGPLSVAVQLYADPKIRFTVGPTCFLPRPRVASAVIQLHRPARLRVPVDETFFLKTVKAAFGHRRKTLQNSLRDAGLESDTIRQALDSSGIVSTRRAETLSLEEFGRLSNILFELGVRI